MSEFPQSNRTWQILDAAIKGNYAVGAYNCYNTDGIMAVIRAAESRSSPAIIQLFPWTIHFQGLHFVKYVVEAAHAAKVPIAVHLDHCIEAHDVDIALTLPFDSIMVDASTLEPAQNITTCKKIVEIANAKGIAIEAEMGRIEGGEDGLPDVDLETILTTPEKAKEFVDCTGVQFLAPAFGNIHGGYGPGGAKRAWDLKRLADIYNALSPALPLALHGTHHASDELLLEAVKCGMKKINLNKSVRDEYTAFVAKNAGKLELTELKIRSVEIYAQSIMQMMDVLRSSGKA